MQADLPVRVSLRLVRALAEEHEQALVDLAVRRGLVPAAKAEEAAREGAVSGESMVSRGWIDAGQLEALRETVRALEYIPMAMGGAADLPEEAREALQDPGRSLQEFLLVSKLGGGGAGEVWRAWDRQLGRWVAVKRPLSKPSARAWERFRREALAAAKLVHPNIVPIYRVAEDQGRPYIVMRLVEGRTLATAKLPRRDAIAAMRTVSLAVHHAHEQGVVHRDIKPHNIMVDGQGTVWLLDFGLAHLGEMTEENETSGAVLGTPAYMSPEQAAGDDLAQQPSTDVYSLGATLYELVTGRPPFQGATTAELLRRVIADECLPPRRIDPAIPADVETVILKAMEKDPERRYITAAQLAEDLRRVLEDEPIAARPAPWMLRTRRAIRKRRSALALGLGAAAVAAAIAAWAGLAAGKSSQLRDLLARAGRAESERRLPEARDLFTQVIGLDPANAAGRDGRSRVDLAIAREETAHERLRAEKAERQREALLLLEKSRPAMQAAADWMYEPSGGVEDLAALAGVARPLIEQALLKAPDLPLAHDLLGRLHLALGDRERAKASWREAIRLDPLWAPAHYFLGRALCEEMAVDAFVTIPMGGIKDASQLQSRRDETFGHLEKARELRSGLDDDLQRTIAEAFLVYAGHDRDATMAVVVPALDRFGSRRGTEALYLIRALLTPLGEQSAFLDQALRTCPKYPWALLVRATVKMRKGAMDEALADCNECVRLFPGFAHGYILRSQFGLHARREIRLALIDLDTALSLSPDEGFARYNRAIFRRMTGDLEGALADIDRVIVGGGTGKVQARLERAKILIVKGDAEAAQNELEAAREAGARMEEVLGLRGRLLLMCRKWSRAAEDLSRALEVMPNQPVWLIDRASAYRHLDRTTDAIEDLAKAVAVDPRNPDAWFVRALVMNQVGRKDEAAADSRRALEFAPAGWPRRSILERYLKTHDAPADEY